MVQIVKLQKNKNVTLPTWFIRRFKMQPGDFLQIEETRDGVSMKPRRLIDPTQAYFWTKEWQKGEYEVEQERQNGKSKKFRSMKDLVRDLDK